MSNSPHVCSADPQHGVSAIDDSYARTMLMDIRALRRRLVEAWKDRGLTLTSEERTQLRDEIRDTCALLTDLTSTN